MTALLIDLKQRGLMEDMLVVWGGEFGRTPMQENRPRSPILFDGCCGESNSRGVGMRISEFGFIRLMDYLDYLSTESQ